MSSPFRPLGLARFWHFALLKWSPWDRWDSWWTSQHNSVVTSDEHGWPAAIFGVTHTLTRRNPYPQPGVRDTPNMGEGFTTTSISVYSRPFPVLLHYSFLLFQSLFFSVPFRCVRTIPSPHHTSVSVCLILSIFHIRIRSNPSEFQLRFILLPLLFGYNPYQPNPVVLRPLIVLCSVLTLLFRYV